MKEGAVLGNPRQTPTPREPGVVPLMVAAASSTQTHPVGSTSQSGAVLSGRPLARGNADRFAARRSASYGPTMTDDRTKEEREAEALLALIQARTRYDALFGEPEPLTPGVDVAGMTSEQLEALDALHRADEALKLIQAEP